MRTRIYPSNAARQKAWRDRKREALKRATVMVCIETQVSLRDDRTQTEWAVLGRLVAAMADVERSANGKLTR